MNMDRREFCALTASVLLGRRETVSPVAGKGIYHESARDIPLDETSEIIVVGGGPAGVAAAWNAAKAGGKVCLLEANGCLGGVWTSGLLTYIYDFNKTATDREIVRRLEALGAVRFDKAGYDVRKDFVYEPEYMKLVCEDMLTEAGVNFILDSPVVAAYRDSTGRALDVVVTESKSGRRAYRARQFVDCSGDGDLAAFAGCGFDMGFYSDGTGQPATLNALVIVKDEEQVREFVSNHTAMWAKNGGHADAMHAFVKELRRAGVEPSYADPTLFRVHGNLLMLMATHAYKLRIDDADAISRATVLARKEIFSLVAALNRLGGPWEGMRVVATAERIGHRDARRIHGRYMLTKEDVERGATFEDAITTSRFGIDIHGLDLKMNKGFGAGQTLGAKFKPFQIPLRACRSKDVDNLWMAGRNISGDFFAHASYRVTGTSVALGEAVGRTVARWGKNGGI